MNEVCPLPVFVDEHALMLGPVDPNHALIFALPDLVLHVCSQLLPMRPQDFLTHLNCAKVIHVVLQKLPENLHVLCDYTILQWDGLTVAWPLKRMVADLPYHPWRNFKRECEVNSVVPATPVEYVWNITDNWRETCSVKINVFWRLAKCVKERLRLITLCDGCIVPRVSIECNWRVVGGLAVRHACSQSECGKIDRNHQHHCGRVLEPHPAD
mmetsp:Transcript_39579/g.78281  ORF Transcript_39579/g.78281 Transcript_39579/m.78281 type:complete len:212 (-) Transcript_39579:715-1350(-)